MGRLEVYLPAEVQQLLSEDRPECKPFSYLQLSGVEGYFQGCNEVSLRDAPHSPFRCAVSPAGDGDGRELIPCPLDVRDWPRHPGVDPPRGRAAGSSIVLPRRIVLRGEQPRVPEQGWTPSRRYLGRVSSRVALQVAQMEAFEQICRRVSACVRSGRRRAPCSPGSCPRSNPRGKASQPLPKSGRDLRSHSPLYHLCCEHLVLRFLK